MHLRAAMSRAFPALLCAAILGCGSSASGPGTMRVHLVDGPDDTYASIVLQVKTLEIHGPTGWETLADFTGTKDGALTVDLLSLRGLDQKGLPIKATLTDGVALPAGHYDQMRMVLGAGNTVTLAGTPTPPPIKLTVPSGMQSGVKFPVSFDVAPGTTRDVFIDFDAHRSIFVHEAGHSGKYLLRPVVRAVDRLVTGSISGTLTAAVVGTTLGGVEVMAEVIQGGHPVVVRSVVSDPITGKYTLDLLPAGVSYYVVAQPIVGATVYRPAASPALPISEASPTFTQDLIFEAAPPAQVGSVTGGITPAITSSSQSDTVIVLGSFAGTSLLVRSVSALVGATEETYLVSNLPLYDGGYSLVVERGTVAGEVTTLSWSGVGGPVLPTGAASVNAVLNLAFP